MSVSILAGDHIEIVCLMELPMYSAFLMKHTHTHIYVKYANLPTFPLLFHIRERLSNPNMTDERSYASITACELICYRYYILAIQINTTM